MSIFAKVLEYEEFGQVLIYTDLNTEDDNDCEYSLFIKTQAPEDSVAAYISVERGLNLESLADLNDWFGKLLGDEDSLDALIISSLTDMYHMFSMDAEIEEEDDE